MDDFGRMGNELPENGEAGPLVVQAVERMAAGRMAVGLPPLGVLALVALWQSLRRGFQVADDLVLLFGAILSMVAMVAYGLQAVASVLEKPSPWSGLIFAGSFVPLVFGGYVILTRLLYLLGLGMAAGMGPVLWNGMLMVLAALCIRAQWRLVEVHLLAREMAGLGKIGMDRGVP